MNCVAQSNRQRRNRRWKIFICRSKPKRRTKAQIAREAGLEPLADALLADPTLDPEQEAVKYVKVVAAAEGVEAVNVPDAKAALGARDILVERFAETADLLAALRAKLWNEGIVTSTVLPGKETAKKRSFAIIMPIRKRFARFPSSRPGDVPWPYAGVLKLDLGLGETLDAPGAASPRRAHCRSLRY